MNERMPLTPSRSRAFWEITFGAFLMILSLSGFFAGAMGSDIRILLFSLLVFSAAALLTSVGLSPFLGRAPKLTLNKEGLAAYSLAGLSQKFYSWADLGPISIQTTHSRGYTGRKIVAQYALQSVVKGAGQALVSETPRYLVFALHHTEQNKNDDLATQVAEICERWRQRHKHSARKMITDADIKRLESAKRRRGIVALAITLFVVAGVLLLNLT